MNENFASEDQPIPSGTKGIPVVEKVKEDILSIAPSENDVTDDLNKRIEKGIRKYGEPLKTFNGRNALVDAYQEALDLLVYLKQLILETENDDVAIADIYEKSIYNAIILRGKIDEVEQG